MLVIYILPNYQEMMSTYSKWSFLNNANVKVNLHTVLLAFVVVVHVSKGEYFFFLSFFIWLNKKLVFNNYIVKYWLNN